MEQPTTPPAATAAPGTGQYRRQRGIALLLTLGFISLLFMMALGFMMTTRSQLGIAQAKSDLISTRLLAESGLNQALAYLKTTNTSSYYPGGLFPLATNSATWGQRRCYVPTSSDTNVQADPTGTSTDVFAVSFKNTASAYFTPNGVPQNDTAWNLISSTNGSFIGRYTYVIIDESGKIDPNGVTSSASGGSRVKQYYDLTGTYTAGDFFFGVDNTGTATTAAVAEGSEVRSGGSPQEINLANAFPLTTFTSAMATFTSNLNGAPLWFSWAHLGATGTGNVQLGALPTGTNSLLNVPYTTAGTAGETLFDSIFPYSYDIEAWRAPDAGSTDPEIHRFDLSGRFHPYETGSNFWDTTALTGAQKIAMLLNATSTSAYYTSSGTVNPNPTTCIPWLTFMKNSSDSLITATQVAANLIDYCDADNTPTNNYTAAIGTPTAASGYNPPSADYVGREVVPYINEVDLAITVKSTGSATKTYTWTFSASGEVININTNTAFTNTMTTSLNIDVVYTITPNVVATWVAPSPAGATISEYGASWKGSLTSSMAPTAGRYAQVSTTYTKRYTSPSLPAGPQITIKKVYATLCSNTNTPSSANILDFAKIYDDATGTSLSYPAPASGLDAGVTKYASFQAADPRYGLYPANWIPQIGNSDQSTLGTYNNSTSLANPSWGTSNNSDPEPATANIVADKTANSAVNISTAYIANRPIQSLWELGCIYRGEKWRTINLKTFAYDAAGNPKTNIGRYDIGDAAILDQVKLGPFTSMRGRVNINSRSANVWNALASDVRIGWPYSALGTGVTANSTGTAMSSFNPTWLTSTNGTGASTGALALKAYQSRGAAAEMLAGAAVLSAATDAGKEELIGKLANLLTARQNYFTIIVTAQLLGTATSDTFNAFSYNSQYYVKKAEQRIMAVVYRDAVTKKFRIERVQYIDE